MPVVLAPLAGGSSTPQLAAAVSGAGGLGFLASGYLTAEQTAGAVTAARALTDRPLGVNVFVPGAGPSDAGTYAAYVERLRDWARRTGGSSARRVSATTGGRRSSTCSPPIRWRLSPSPSAALRWRSSSA